jgi:hypothetical protein
MTDDLFDATVAAVVAKRGFRPKRASKAGGGAGMKALGRLPVGTMNKTEARYAKLLDDRLHAGEILWYKFEGVKLRLADNTFYSPDFFVMLADGTLEVHEIKGFFTEDAKVKVKVAAAMYPFQFIVIRLVKNEWVYEEF